jgi:hypothetical protein
MKKPDGKAEAGWYDAPEIDGYLQYWNGKFWTKKKQIKDGFEDLEIPSDYELGIFLFRRPIMSDGIFIIYLIIAGITLAYLVVDYLEFTSGFTTVLLLIPAFTITLIWIYIIFLLVLIPRRIFDKKKGITKSGASNKRSINLDNNPSVLEVKNKSRNNYLFVISIIVIVFLIVIFFNSKPLNRNEGDKYFEVEQRISKVIGEWNVAATPISEAMQSITNGDMDAAQARQIIGDTSSKFAVIHNKLDDECSTIPKYDLNSTGFEFASAKAYDALKVTCDLLPQESIEIISLVNAQISETGTQADIDYHQNEIAIIIEKRRTAMLESLDAMEPYLNEAQKQTFQRLRDNFLK